MLRVLYIRTPHLAVAYSIHDVLSPYATQRFSEPMTSYILSSISWEPAPIPVLFMQ
jgi:hypothetical protein